MRDRYARNARRDRAAGACARRSGGRPRARRRAALSTSWSAPGAGRPRRRTRPSSRQIRADRRRASRSSASAATTSSAGSCAAPGEITGLVTNFYDVEEPDRASRRASARREVRHRRDLPGGPRHLPLHRRDDRRPIFERPAAVRYVEPRRLRSTADDARRADLDERTELAACGTAAEPRSRGGEGDAIVCTVAGDRGRGRLAPSMTATTAPGDTEAGSPPRRWLISLEYDSRRPVARDRSASDSRRRWPQPRLPRRDADVPGRELGSTARPLPR